MATEVDPGDRLRCFVADLTSDDGWADAVDGCDYVLNPDDLIVPARDGALRVLRAATRAGVTRVVMTSAANAASPSSYTQDGVTNETLWTGLDVPGLPAYRRSKTMAEKAAWAFHGRGAGPRPRWRRSCPAPCSGRSSPPTTWARSR